MNIASLIASFATGTYTVTRTARGTTSYGIISDGTTTTFSISASVQPMGRDLSKPPEGRIANEQFVVYTTTELYTGDQVGQTEGSNQADLITIDGKQFQVERVEKWTDALTGNVGYRCVVASSDI